MPLELTTDCARLSGPCDIAEAEHLLDWFKTQGNPVVDVSDAGHVHAAIFQLVLHLRPQLIGAEDRADWRALLTGPLELT